MMLTVIVVMIVVMMMMMMMMMMMSRGRMDGRRKDERGGGDMNLAVVAVRPSARAGSGRKDRDNSVARPIEGRRECGGSSSSS